MKWIRHYFYPDSLTACTPFLHSCFLIVLLLLSVNGDLNLYGQYMLLYDDYKDYFVWPPCLNVAHMPYIVNLGI